MDIVYPTASHRLMRSPSRPRRRRRRPPLSCPCSTCRLATPTLRMRTHARLEWGECARAGGGGESRAPGRWPPTAALGFATLTLSTRPKSSALFMLSMASAASPRSSNWTNAKPRCFSAHTERRRGQQHRRAWHVFFRGKRARVAASSTKFTSVISPKGRKAACRISVVTLSSSPPGGEVGCEPPTKGRRGARAHAPT